MKPDLCTGMHLLLHIKLLVVNSIDGSAALSSSSLSCSAFLPPAALLLLPAHDRLQVKYSGTPDASYCRVIVQDACAWGNMALADSSMQTAACQLTCATVQPAEPLLLTTLCRLL